jgi:transposase
LLTLPPSVRIYLATEPVDMRKGFDGLMAIVRNLWSRDPFTGHLYVFISRRRDRAKVLWWDDGGFVLYYKRLEAGRYKMPTVGPGEQTVRLEASQLAMLLSGIDLSRVRKPRRWLPGDVANGGRYAPRIDRSAKP